MKLTISSPMFQEAQPIPKKYTGEGLNISPAIQWSGIPEGTQELVLMCEDPDAPQPEPFVHWLIYRLPPKLSGLPEAIAPHEVIEEPITAYQGINSTGKAGYTGPMPPVGHGVHHYFFKLYALDQPLNLKPGLTKAELLDAMEGHLLDTAQLIGIYMRPSNKLLAA